MSSTPTTNKKPFFISSLNLPDYTRIMDESYAMAKAEALRIYQLRGIQTKIELLRPVHLGPTTTGAPALPTTGGTVYNLPGSANSTWVLKSNVALFPWGVINNDPTWFALKWYEGAATKYIGDWVVRPVYFFEEQQAAWGGQLEPYAFRGDQTFTFNCVSNTGSVVIQGWLLAYAVMPTTLEETRITV